MYKGPGLYRHYKGGIYEALGIATQVSNKEQLVVYKNDQDEFYARPLKEWDENVRVDGVEQERFLYMHDLITDSDPVTGETHTDHPLRHYDRTCPGCNPEYGSPDGC